MYTMPRQRHPLQSQFCATVQPHKIICTCLEACSKMCESCRADVPNTCVQHAALCWQPLAATVATTDQGRPKLARNWANHCPNNTPTASPTKNNKPHSPQTPHAYVLLPCDPCQPAAGAVTAAPAAIQHNTMCGAAAAAQATLATSLPSVPVAMAGRAAAAGLSAMALGR